MKKRNSKAYLKRRKTHQADTQSGERVISVDYRGTPLRDRHNISNLKVGEDKEMPTTEKQVTFSDEASIINLKKRSLKREKKTKMESIMGSLSSSSLQMIKSITSTRKSGKENTPSGEQIRK